MSSNDLDAPIQATANSLTILEAVNEMDGARLTEIADRTEFAESTVYNHLKTLERRGYLIRRHGVYYLGLKFFHVGMCAVDRVGFLDEVKQVARDLAGSVHEEVSFNIAEFGRLITLDHAVPHTDDTGFQVGQYFYLHNTGSGKAILAAKPREYVERVVENWGLPEETERTITDSEELFEDLERTRDRGYAICDQEWVEGYRSLGRVVTDQKGRIVGAMSIGGPTYRMNMEQINDGLADQLIDTTEELADRIGSAVVDMSPDGDGTDWSRMN